MGLFYKKKLATQIKYIISMFLTCDD